MELGEDISARALALTIPGRPIRSYPALLSTEADAMAWARAGAPEGALVVAGYQASPRGRAGLEWHMRAGEDLGFSLVLRPRLPCDREGWMYCIAACGVADSIGDAAAIEWPDEVLADGARKGAVSVQAKLGPRTIEWSVINVLIIDAKPPRGEVLAKTIAAIEARYRSASSSVLADYRRHCTTLGRSINTRLIPLGPNAREVSGTAVTVLPDGALVLETASGARVAVRPQSIGSISGSS